MHIAICDDNTHELSRIATLLDEYKSEREADISYDTFQSTIDLLETMKDVRYDLLILDIIMPGTNGMEAAKELRKSNCDIAIIFITSSREYAVESYRVKAEDYIIKPAKKEEFFDILDKQLVSLSRNEAYLTLKTGNGIVKLVFSQIVYVEVINRSVHFILINGDIRLAYGYLNDYEYYLLSDPHFFKPHRSYIVNFRYITELNKNGFTTILGNTIPVARDTYAKAKAEYMKYLLSSYERRDSI